MGNNNMVSIAAWSDGFYLYNLDDAVVCDDAGSFECGNHKVIEIEKGCSEITIQAAIREAFKPEANQQEGKEVLPAA